MKEEVGLPATEMREDTPAIPGSWREEVPPNSFNSPRISELAFQSAFAFHSDITDVSAKSDK
ncbi:MAG: hypothetical protein A3B06_02640 [Candidatus Yonathbacteria bacterium RIFCSPLOWO2_01_FULL_43_20]|uniref:Uncharacterized protein n=1 Tax=Candidatus Yonathbacteria bacterium RIFCSPHIGHO2_02_FULL_44_14 TaxID=1802724 RepID=A0A1G2SAB6_9BACT|nr:MAG: hypothetical protein A3D51_02705 [Candidatus Yonathbacteria bacterium RIFCSPHIGHO2_02_FULL_44_14]OHA81839.1 MAG: hypothetical protein A3B06_02640 [Candidatus Yonathbacteria bacterium RIFCSPLOWO2_01_FULL_43_20]